MRSPNPLAAAMLLAAACGEGGPSSRCAGPSLLTGQIAAGDLDDSRRAWAELKASLGGTYCYDRAESYFSGDRIEAAIRVADDRVLSRTVDATRTGYAHEEGERISTSGALPGLTMEQLYDLCEREVLVQPRSENDVTFNVADNGVLLHCYFVPKGCADDCTTGVLIDHLTPDVN